MDVCRICAGSKHLKCFQGNEQLTELLKVCANVTVKEDDILPKHICEQCEFGLRFSYSLRKQSEATERRLRQGMVMPAISTTAHVQDTIVLDDDEPEPPSLTVNSNSQERTASDLSINICTSTNEVREDYSTANAVPSAQEILAAKRLRLDIDDQQVIAEKRIQLEYDAQGLDEYTNEEIQLDEEVENAHFDLNEAMNDCDDVIELIDDDDSLMLESPREENPQESDYDKLNANDGQTQDLIEEILSSGDDEANRKEFDENATVELKPQGGQADIVYETLDDDGEESIDIDECQIDFTKEEREDDDCDTYLENESNKTQETEVAMDDGDSSSQEKQAEQEEEVASGTTFKMHKGKVLSYNCDTCNLDFDSHREYRDHIKTHGDKRFCCKQCDKWFPHISRLERHAKSHKMDGERLSCPHCDRTYRSRDNLTRHLRSAHDVNTALCPVCGEAFGRGDILKNHMATHSNDREYQCDKCPIRFKTKISFTKHVRMHAKVEDVEKSKPDDDTTAKKSFCCHFCGKISKHYFTHKMHMRIHAHERPHKCDACGKSFCTVAALITHERIHDNVRPYQCEHCLLSFRQQAHLKEHRMIHEGITPHVCSICKLAFTKKNNMLVHMRIHSGENPYKCVSCGEQFKKSAQLRKHNKSVHNKEVDDQVKETEKLDKAGNDEEVKEKEDEEEEEEEGEEEEGEEKGEDEQENQQENLHENDHNSRFADLASEQLFSDSNSLEVIEAENGPAIQEGIAAEISDVTKSAELVSSISNNFSDDFNVDDDNGVVLVVDDNAKFNSLFIMDD
ncbi:zinc finger protein 502-like [Anastrepha ludens]|uniref:zinc finger protein 502-like n=1 Tax=Anastrepha ludens TaxID=28586 RepID=UPI0023AF6D7C|nr:zinc finger protein 502-like [Anastrepha ludens]